MTSDYSAFSVREKLGVIQEFEILIELSWKLMKDYLEYEGMVLISKSPKSVIKESLKVGIVKDETGWLAMYNDRNIFAHAYAPDHFDKALSVFAEQYYPYFKDLHAFFRTRKD